MPPVPPKTANVRRSSIAHRLLDTGRAAQYQGVIKPYVRQNPAPTTAQRARAIRANVPLAHPGLTPGAHAVLTSKAVLSQVENNQLVDMLTSMGAMGAAGHEGAIDDSAAMATAMNGPGGDVGPAGNAPAAHDGEGGVATQGDVRSYYVTYYENVGKAQGVPL